MWGTKMRFNITDISADLVMQVFSVGGSFDTPKLIGQAIVPLHRLLPKIGTNSSKVLYTVTSVNIPRP